MGRIYNAAYQVRYRFVDSPSLPRSAGAIACKGIVCHTVQDLLSQHAKYDAARLVLYPVVDPCAFHGLRTVAPHAHHGMTQKALPSAVRVQGRAVGHSGTNVFVYLAKRSVYGAGSGCVGVNGTR